MISIRFQAHRACYREVMQEIRDENPNDSVEFDIFFSDDPDSMMCSKRCKEFFEVADNFDQPAIRKDRRNAKK